MFFFYFFHSSYRKLCEDHESPHFLWVYDKCYCSFSINWHQFFFGFFSNFFNPSPKKNAALLNHVFNPLNIILLGYKMPGKLLGLRPKTIFHWIYAIFTISNKIVSKCLRDRKKLIVKFLLHDNKFSSMKLIFSSLPRKFFTWQNFF